MKKLLIFILLLLLYSCNYPSSTKETKGVITQIQQQQGKVVVEVKFKADASENLYNYYWFTGSDTCKIGQIVELK